MSFAPGHISLTFAIHSDSDFSKMGSTGLGIVLPQGVYCSIIEENLDENNNIIFVNNERIDDPVVMRAIQLLGHDNKGLSIYREIT